MIGFAAGSAVALAIGAAAITRSGPFALGGFLAMALPGIASGLWLVRAHGRPGGGFVIGLASGFVARLVLTAVGAFFAARAGDGAPIALLTGLAAGFVPMFLWEMVWFGRAAMAARPRAGAGRCASPSRKPPRRRPARRPKHRSTSPI
jgi:hypothetical protein